MLLKGCGILLQGWHSEDPDIIICIFDFIHDPPFISLVIKGRTLIFLVLSDLDQAMKKFPDLLSFEGPKTLLIHGFLLQTPEGDNAAQGGPEMLDWTPVLLTQFINLKLDPFCLITFTSRRPHFSPTYQ